MQHFVSQGTWDDQAVGRRYRALLAGAFADSAGVFVLDDTTFPEAGTHCLTPCTTAVRASCTMFTARDAGGRLSGRL